MSVAEQPHGARHGGRRRRVAAAQIERVRAAFAARTGAPAAWSWFVPGRLEVFGKHTDYAGGRTLVAAVPRGFAVAAGPRNDGRVRVSDLRADVAADIDPADDARTLTGWASYVQVVARRLAQNFPGAPLGVDLVFASDLPRAAGMSSSSALVVGVATALAARARTGRPRRMAADAAHRPRTSRRISAASRTAWTSAPARHGRRWHARRQRRPHAIMACRAGHVSQFRFMPATPLGDTPLPPHWTFVVASSGVHADKAGSVRSASTGPRWRRGRCSRAGTASRRRRPPRWPRRSRVLAPLEELRARVAAAPAEGFTTDGLLRRLAHFVAEDGRVPAAARACAEADVAAIGRLSDASQHDAEALLENQVPETSALVAAGARLRRLRRDELRRRLRRQRVGARAHRRCRAVRGRVARRLCPARSRARRHRVVRRASVARARRGRARRRSRMLTTARRMHADLQEALDFHHAVLAEGARALVGYDMAKAVANVVLMSEIPTTYDKRSERQVNAGNLLLRGVPGVGKTFFGVILAAISDAKFARIQGRADLQPTEVVGFQMINPATGQLVTEFGPMASAEVILLDEINRIPLKSQSAFLEGLQDRTITVGKDTYDLPAFSFAIATMNPVELGQGTFPLSEAATDRFAAMVQIGYLPKEQEEKLVDFDFKRMTCGRCSQGAHHPAARPHQRTACSCTRAWGATCSGWSARRVRATRRPTGWNTRPRRWSSAASIWARRRARSSAGAAWPRPGRCCKAAGPRSIPKTSRRWRPSCSATASGSGRTPPRRAHRRSRHRRRDRGGADSMTHAPAATSFVDLNALTKIELLVLKRLPAARPASTAAAPTGRASISWGCATGRPATASRRSTGPSRRSRTSRRSSCASSISRAPPPCWPWPTIALDPLRGRRHADRAPSWAARSPRSGCRRRSSRTASAC